MLEKKAAALVPAKRLATIIKKVKPELATLHPDLYQLCFLPILIEQWEGEQETMARWHRIGKILTQANQMVPDQSISALGRHLKISESSARKAVSIYKKYTEKELEDLSRQDVNYGMIRHVVDLEDKDRKRFTDLAIKHNLDETSLHAEIKKALTNRKSTQGGRTPSPGGNVFNDFNKMTEMAGTFLRLATQQWEPNLLPRLTELPDNEANLQDLELLSENLGAISKEATVVATTVRERCAGMRVKLNLGGKAPDIDLDAAAKDVSPKRAKAKAPKAAAKPATVKTVPDTAPSHAPSANGKATAFGYQGGMSRAQIRAAKANG